MARDNGVIMLSLPPHCTHRMQPLDVSFFKPLKEYYNRACEAFLRTNVGRRVQVDNVSALFCTAYTKAVTMSTAVNGFRKTGIWPCNRFALEGYEAEEIGSPSTTDETDFQMPI